MDGPNDPLVRSYENFLCVNCYSDYVPRLICRHSIRKNASGTGSPIELLIQSCFQYLPEPLLASLVANMPGEAMSQMRENQKIVHRLARGWIADKAHALETGKGQRDIMTLLGNHLASIQAFVCTEITSVKANSSHDPRTRLSEYEMISQIRSAVHLNLDEFRPLFYYQYDSPRGSRDDIEFHELHAMGVGEASRRAGVPSTGDRVRKDSQGWCSIHRGRF